MSKASLFNLQTPVEEVCEFIVDCVNKTAPVVEFVTPFKMIRTTNIRNGRVDLTDCKYVSAETYDKWTRRATVQEDDILLTREAPIGEVGIFRGNEKVFLGQRVMQYRPDKNKVSPRFLYYSFLSKGLRQQFGAHEGSGSVVSHIRVGDCSKFRIPRPDMGTQRAIAHILGTLDDKIELLRQTNETLEAMVRALFKSWFVDFDPVRKKSEGKPTGLPKEIDDLFPSEFEDSELGEIPKGWKVGTVSDLVKLKYGKALKDENREESGSFEVFGSNGPIGRHSTFLSGDKGFVVGRKGANAGSLFWADGPHFVIDTAFYVEQSSEISLKYAFRSLETLGLKSYQADSAIPGVNREVIEGIPVVLPLLALATRFTEAGCKYQETISSNLLVAGTLSNLRDSLLPKLISGELELTEEMITQILEPAK